MPEFHYPRARGLLTKNLTPFLFATRPTSRRERSVEAALIVKGCFAIQPGQPLQVLEGCDQPPIFGGELEDPDELASEQLRPSDLADFKPHAEVIVHGTCHAPGDKKLLQCDVSVALGAWSKVVRVFGPRVWHGDAPGKPQGFESLPIRWDQTAGGPDDAFNPVGIASTADLVPPIELPHEPRTSRDQAIRPAGLGPVNPEWPSRRGTLGKDYDDDYRKMRAPFYAEDFDWTYFQSAPPDQWLPQPPRGDEEMRFVHLHPEAADVRVQLPGLRVRAFVKDRTGHFREAPMQIDTIFADFEKGHLFITWRGHTPAAEDDLRDLTHALIATEPLDGPEETQAFYRMKLEAFEEDPVGLFEKAPELRGMLDADPSKGPPPATPSEWLATHFGAGIASKNAKATNALDGMGKSKASGFGDNPAAQAAAKNNLLGELANSLASKNALPAALPRKPGEAPKPPLRRVFRDIKAARRTEDPSDAVKQRLPADKLAALEASKQDVADFENHPTWKQIDPDYEPPGELGTDEPAAYANLRERDFRGADLSGRDLSGADFTDANLMEANLQGTKLLGANLTRAILHLADLRGAVLREANLTQAHVGGANAEGADFSGACIEQALFDEANLRSAKLNDAKGDYVGFTKADLTSAEAKKLVSKFPQFTAATLDHACLAGSTFVRPSFERCSAKGADLSGGTFEMGSFQEGVFDDAHFTNAVAETSYWAGASLVGTDFTRAALRGAHLSECDASNATFVAADMADARLNRVLLKDACLDRANLYRADLCKALFEKTSFRSACLYEAKLLKVVDRGADLGEANLTGYLYQRA